MNIVEYSWVGSQDPYVDVINIQHVGRMVLGRFGGNSTAGQYKNEDGCLLWSSESQDWEFTVLLDAHTTAESAELVVNTVKSLKTEIVTLLMMPPVKAFEQVGGLLLNKFKSQDFKEECRRIKGETAFLCVIRKGSFLWWLSIGDCILHLFHPELAAFDEYQQNHRSFYEWVGRVNTFELPVPCFSTGTKEMRKGRNHIFLTTDGLTECSNTNFDDPKEIFNLFSKCSNEEGVRELLNFIKDNGVRDSTTIISWKINAEHEGSQPSS
ncbi:protein phosphatase [Sporosarcina globispora]|uniref:Protein phosphatase n=1 Tax=Sporosarcina globispora TaxID=1459 RepID=A0A0M0GGX9_SPOGL|nr:protein phosphatase 2C domain-containing protein [Sporosarcina globispora]KON88701.1 protein phosphatase [Sporosarcina globispora]